jgi:N-acetylmuramoyl-L-alanine amidase
MRVSILALFLTFAVAGLAPAVAGDGPAVTAVRIGQHGLETRFVVDLSAAVSYRVFRLSNPDRVAIDFADIDWRLAGPPRLTGKGAIDSVRFGQLHPGLSRIVLDLAAGMRMKDSFLLPPASGFPHRLVFDFVPVDPATNEGPAHASSPGYASPPPPSPPRARAATVATAAVPMPRMKPRRAAPRVIVIDAGHGGPDPGTIGSSGTREKDIVLTTAFQIRDRLAASGRYEVVLTRDRDTYLKLRDRVRIGREHGADLFISLHADAHPVRGTRGVSVYTLSEKASDAEAGALAEKENKSDIIAGYDLSDENIEVANILIDLAQRETMNRSAVFANALIRELGLRVMLLRRTHRFAGFAVLKAPDVPSVLIELGYLSNKKEEKLLRSKAHRDKIADAILEAVGDYFAGQARLARS